jgi:hypothetical protein
VKGKCNNTVTQWRETERETHTHTQHRDDKK